MTLVPLFSKTAKLVVDFFLPWGDCRLCGDKIVFGAVPGVCFACFRKREKIKVPACQICARELPAIAEPCICGMCQDQKPSYEKHFNRYRYDGAIREIVLLFKTERRYPLAGVIGKSIGREVTKNCSGQNLAYVTFIPGFVRRKLWRRFTPAELIARTVSKELHVPFAEFLTMAKRVKIQKGLTAEERMENVKGAFRCSRLFSKGEEILLIDDIFTTGSTLEEASRILKKSGAKVYTATFAMACKRKLDLQSGPGVPGLEAETAEAT